MEIVDTKRYFVFDIDCDHQLPVVCDKTKEFFTLRGLCPHSVIDSLYRLLKDNNRKVFIGVTGWRIEWDGETNMWNILNPRYKSERFHLF